MTDGSGILVADLSFNECGWLLTGGILPTNTLASRRVTGSLEANLGRNPLQRWAGLVMGALMGGDRTAALAKLKVQEEERR